MGEKRTRVCSQHFMCSKVVALAVSASPNTSLSTHPLWQVIAPVHSPAVPRHYCAASGGPSLPAPCPSCPVTSEATAVPWTAQTRCPPGWSPASSRDLSVHTFPPRAGIRRCRALVLLKCMSKCSCFTLPQPHVGLFPNHMEAAGSLCLSAIVREPRSSKAVPAKSDALEAAASLLAERIRLLSFKAPSLLCCSSQPSCFQMSLSEHVPNPTLEPRGLFSLELCPQHMEYLNGRVPRWGQGT